MTPVDLLIIAIIWLLGYLFMSNSCCPLEEVTTPPWVTGNSDWTRANKETPPVVWASLLDHTLYTWFATSTYRLVGLSQECHPSSFYIALLVWAQAAPYQRLVIIDDKPTLEG